MAEMSGATCTSGHKESNNAGIDDTGLGGTLSPARLGACMDMFRVGYSQVLQLKVGQPKGFRGAHLSEISQYEGRSFRMPPKSIPRQGSCSVIKEGSQREIQKPRQQQGLCNLHHRSGMFGILIGMFCSHD